MLTNKGLAKDMKLLLRDIKQLFVSIDKLDAKLNLIFENQKKYRELLQKEKWKCLCYFQKKIRVLYQFLDQCSITWW